MKRSFLSPVVKVDIVTGQVIVCRIKEIWNEMVAISMTAEEYSFWIKQEIARQRRDYEVIRRVQGQISTTATKKNELNTSPRRKGNIVEPDVLEYLLNKLDHGADPKELSEITGVGSSTIHKMRRETDKYRRYLQAYRLHDKGFSILEITTQTGLTSGTVQLLIRKYTALSQLAS